MTPNVAIVQIHNPYWRSCRLWLPLFLLWIPLVLLAPFLLLVWLVICLLLGVSFTRSISVLWGILCALPGTDVRVQVEHNHILVKVL